MNAIDDYYQNDHDFRYDMLVETLAKNHINTNEADLIDRWLTSEVDKQLMQNAIAKAIGNSKDSEKIRICNRLQKYASGIAEQFGFLQQFSELDHIMSHAFRLIMKPDAATDSERNQWAEFRNRMAAEAKLLAGVVDQASKQIKESETKKKGRLPDEWRSALILDLYNYLAGISNTTQEQCSLLTHAVFDIYFHDDCPNEPASMKKIVTREQSKTARTESHDCV